MKRYERLANEEPEGNGFISGYLQAIEDVLKLPKLFVGLLGHAEFPPEDCKQILVGDIKKLKDQEETED